MGAFQIFKILQMVLIRAKRLICETLPYFHSHLKHMSEFTGQLTLMLAQNCIYDPVKHLRWKLLRKYSTAFIPKLFSQKFIIDVW